jgi:hypothetical protein
MSTPPPAAKPAHWPRRIIVRRRELWKGWSGDNDPGKFKEFVAESRAFWPGTETPLEPRCS